MTEDCRSWVQEENQLSVFFLPSLLTSRHTGVRAHLITIIMFKFCTEKKSFSYYTSRLSQEVWCTCHLQACRCGCSFLVWKSFTLHKCLPLPLPHTHTHMQYQWGTRRRVIRYVSISIAYSKVLPGILHPFHSPPSFPNCGFTHKKMSHWKCQGTLDTTEDTKFRILK